MALTPISQGRAYPGARRMYPTEILKETLSLSPQIREFLMKQQWGPRDLGKLGTPLLVVGTKSSQCRSEDTAGEGQARQFDLDGA